MTGKGTTGRCISFMFIEMKLFHSHSRVMFEMKSMNICSG